MPEKRLREREIEAACGAWIRTLSPTWHFVKCDLHNARGFPDRLVLGPGGTTLFLEFKRPRAKRTPPQRVWAAWLLHNDHAYFVVESVEQFQWIVTTAANMTGSPVEPRPEPPR